MQRGGRFALRGVVLAAFTQMGRARAAYAVRSLMDDISEFLTEIGAHGAVDYAAVKFRGKDVTYALYSNGNKKTDAEALAFLGQAESLSFLKESDILFYSVQSSPKVRRSYEYKPAPSAVKGDALKRLISPWRDSGCYDTILSFSSPRRRANMTGGGIYCFGAEYPQGRAERPQDAVWKIYFNTYFTDETGSRIYDNEMWMGLVRRCSSPRLAQLADRYAPLLSLDMDLHMVGLNYDRLTGGCDHKLYFRTAKPDMSTEAIEAALDDGICKATTRGVLGDERIRSALAFAGLAVSLDDNGAERVNFYFKERTA